MPGIFGYIIKNGNISVRGRNLLEKMGSCLHHFPFYKCGSLNKDKVGMGNMAVNQKVATPVYGNSDYSILISFHGYISGFYDKNMNLVTYDNRPVYKLIFELYSVYGDKFPRYLSGLFNIALYDDEKDTFLICNDRMGFLHQYIYEDEDILIFSPELKAFLAYPNFDRTIDDQALSDYFVFYYQFGDRTFFRNVKLLPPATVITVKHGIVSKRNYWRPKYTKELTRRNLQEATEEGYRIFRENLSRIIANHKRILIPISGGLDSRLILSVASEMGKEIKTATFGTKRCLEYRLAKRVCKELGLDSPQLVNIMPDWFREYGEKVGFLGEASYGTLGVTSLYGFRDILGADYDAFLNGIFGGHISFGSPYYTTADLRANYDENERLKRIIRGFNGHRYESFLKQCFTRKLREKIEWYKNKTIEKEWDRSGACGNDYVFRQDSIFIYNRIRRGINALDHNRFWYNEYFPFASYELYDFYLKLSPELTLNHYLYKEMYKRYIPDLAKIPWQNTGLNLYTSPSAFTRTRALIRKYVVWYTGRLSHGRFEIRDATTWNNNDYNYRKSNKTQKWVRDVLLSEKALSRGYFSKKGVSQLLDREARGGSVFEEISKLVLFELWCQNFLE